MGDDKPKVADIADQIQLYMDQGEPCLVRVEDGFPSCTEYNQEANEIKENHADLYGRLLELSAKVNHAGGAAHWVAVFTALTFSLGLTHRIFDRIFQVNLNEFRSLWFCSLAFFFCLLCSNYYARGQRRRFYLRLRSGIMNGIQRTGYTTYEVLAKLDQEWSVDGALKMIKLDRIDQMDPGR